MKSRSGCRCLFVVGARSLHHRGGPSRQRHRPQARREAAARVAGSTLAGIGEVDGLLEELLVSRLPETGE